MKFFRDASKGRLVKFGDGTSEAERRLWKPRWTRLQFIQSVNRVRSSIPKEEKDYYGTSVVAPELYQLIEDYFDGRIKQERMNETR